MTEHRIKSLAELNKRNQEFYSDEHASMMSRLADEALAATAMEALASDADKQVQVRRRWTLEVGLAKAEEIRRLFLRQQARSGGRATKRDPLQDIILEIVRACPDLTCAELLTALRDRCPNETLQDVDEDSVHFTHRDGRRSDEAPISGLKDRLSRAKKSLRSKKCNRAKR